MIGVRRILIAILAGACSMLCVPAVQAGAVSPLPSSDYSVQSACAAPGPGHAGCLAQLLVPRTAAARARTHPLGITSSHAIDSGAPRKAPMVCARRICGAPISPANTRRARLRTPDDRAGGCLQRPRSRIGPGLTTRISSPRMHHGATVVSSRSTRMVKPAIRLPRSSLAKIEEGSALHSATARNRSRKPPARRWKKSMAGRWRPP